MTKYSGTGKMPKYNPRWLILIVFVVFCITVAVFFVRYQLERADSNCWRDYFASIPQSEYALSRETTYSNLDTINKFENSYTLNGLYIGDRILSKQKLEQLKARLQWRLTELQINKFTSSFPSQLVSLEASQKREAQAQKILELGRLDSVEAYRNKYHTEQCEYALLALRDFSDSDNWQLIDQLFERVVYEISQIADEPAVQSIYLYGPVTLREAERLKELAYRSMLEQILANLRASAWRYPNSSRKVDEFKELLFILQRPPEYFETTNEELEHLRDPS